MMNLPVTTNQLIIVAVVPLTLLAMYTDYRWRTIANRITVPAIALGLLLNLLGSGWYGFLFAVLGLAAGIGLLLLPYLLGGMGGGDVKLMGAIGALLGSYAVLNVFLYTALAGGVMAVAAAVRNKTFVAMMKRVWQLIKLMFLIRSRPDPSHLPDRNTEIPYGLAIGIGTFCFLIMGTII